MREIRLLIRCTLDRDHAKNLRIMRGLEGDVRLKTGKNMAGIIGRVLDGSSSMYIFPPAEKSPIGKCALCGGKLECEILEVEDVE